MANRCLVDELRIRSRGMTGEELRMAVDAWVREAKYLPRIRGGWRRWMGRVPDWLVLPVEGNRQEVKK